MIFICLGSNLFSKFFFKLLVFGLLLALSPVGHLMEGVVDLLSFARRGLGPLFRGLEEILRVVALIEHCGVVLVGLL